MEKEARLRSLTLNVETGIVECQYDVVIFDDGREAHRSSMRATFNPGADLSGEPAAVQEFCEKHWTAEIVDEWQARLGVQTNGDEVFQAWVAERKAKHDEKRAKRAAPHP